MVDAVEDHAMRPSSKKRCFCATGEWTDVSIVRIKYEPGPGARALEIADGQVLIA